MDITVVGTAAVLLTLAAYLLHVNRALSSVPREALSIYPGRFNNADIREAYDRLSNNPISPELPPKTGRRYVVVGGAGFLSGWIVIQLIARGEDPKRIRIIDIRAPTRQDLTTGTASQVAFYKANIGNYEEVLSGFTAPWDDGETSECPVTVFHSAANIRFWERAISLLPLSTRVNVLGTQNVIRACHVIRANVLIYTSSASVATRSTRFWLWPWQKYPKGLVQVLDDDTPLPVKHNDFFSNYAASKAEAERLVRNADRAVLSNGNLLRTGCIRPGNGIYGPGGDMLAGAYLVRKVNYTWVRHIIQSFVYVENCALAHLLYEQRILEMADAAKSRPDIGGQAFNVADPNPPISFGDLYDVLTALSVETKFHDSPPVVMLLLAHIVEGYYLFRLLHPILSAILPEVKGEIIFLQPSLFNLTQVHLVFDDSRARKPAAEGGLEYRPAWTTLEALCNLVMDWGKANKRMEEKFVVGGRLSFATGLETGWVKK
ncbi:NAD(P)-binding protein [Hysterangium stoloniferum]|nr:NAD(P)-binding protein [Hysterangium stoloniferum]